MGQEKKAPYAQKLLRTKNPPLKKKKNKIKNLLKGRQYVMKKMQQ